MQEELLKKPEQKIDARQDEPVLISAQANFDYIQNLIKIRREKLEAIKPFILAKTYALIFEKLEKETEQLNKQIRVKKKEALIQNQSQALPKAFFELAYMKPKNIRID